ncbi:SDR family NAD(P)-dependent oxidoreductase [Jongsikchunia kroppenstedtii]|uniref:SDR family NAD(P)-dependent oxidoreductase n=1 Tax=Jongsikchunia kroppenstedtii TaxID=1121721 RepID=UPI00036D7D01|nr:SDR family oxidoreductase [Jongsikchunia kroppenstedtii]
MTLESRTIIVTGAASGIGEATAVHLAQAGARIAVVDVSPDGKRVAESITADGGDAEYFHTDVADASSVEKMVSAVVTRFGRLDGAFNNAGVEQANLSLHELDPAQWDRAIGVDLTGVFHCLKYEIAAMLETGGGSIVNTASSLGKVAIPNASEYIAAKHGVIGLTLAAATDYGTKGIRVNSVMPGITNTTMVKRLTDDPQFSAFFDKIREHHVIGRFAEPSEIAAAVEWLLSDKASFVTGTALAVDGGFLAV